MIYLSLFSESKTAVILSVSREYTGMHADVFVGDAYVASSRIGHQGQIKFPKRSDTARKLMKLASFIKMISKFSLKILKLSNTLGFDFRKVMNFS